MDPAVASLLGAIIGGTLTAGSNVLLDWVRGKRESKAVSQRDRRDARQAARLIAEEVEYSRRLLRRAHERAIFTWEPPNRLLPSATWTEHRAEFAGGPVSDEEWLTVSRAYAELYRLNWYVRDVIEEDHYLKTGPSSPLEGRELGPNANVPQALGRVDDALRVLRRLMAADV
jgi:hypothetical protein